MTTEVKCQHCGRVCKRNRRHSRAEHLARKFCSNTCRIQSKVKEILPTTCLNCKKEFVRNQSIPPKFCSKECSGQYYGYNKKAGKTMICQYCHAEFYCTKAKLKFTSCRFCSIKCMSLGTRLDPKMLARKNPKVAKSWLLKSKYGITLDDYDKMVKSQGGLCLICKQKTKKLCIDHCHNTQVVRGLLCRQCNAGLGQFQDDTQRLKEAISYLEQFQKT